ncbi:alpha/beta-hydrolase [Meredithblackwellia eburnea MCA 4105]
MSNSYTKFDSLVYKQVQRTLYQVDIFVPTNSEEIIRTASRPALVFYHGGGAISGSRAENGWFPRWLLDLCIQKDIIFISADYSLLSPQTGFDIIQDVKDLFAWIANDLNSKLEDLGSKASIDSTKLAVMGASGGGIPAYYTGLYATPRPRAVIGVYAMGGDTLNDLWTVPKTEPWVTWQNILIPMIDPKSAKPVVDLASPGSDTPPTTETDIETHPRNMLSFWTQQEAIYPDLLTGVKGLGVAIGKHPHEERASKVEDKYRGLFPPLVVDKSFPPTLLLHGIDDKVIPIQESHNFASALTRAGVAHELVEIPGADHGFDFVGSAENFMEWLDKTGPFLDRYLV